MMTDPVADMLTRIRNALRIERQWISMPSSKLKVSIAEALEREGYLWEHRVEEMEPQNVLHVKLKYGPNGERVIEKIWRTSKPGCRVYSKAGDLKGVRQGLGVSILSTSKGVLSNREAKKQGVGGEVLCTLY